MTQEIEIIIDEPIVLTLGAQQSFPSHDTPSVIAFTCAGTVGSVSTPPGNDCCAPIVNTIGSSISISISCVVL